MIDEEVFERAPEIEALRMGMGIAKDDLRKPYIVLESTYGDSHPGSFGLDRLVKVAERRFKERGLICGKFYTTDICDGIAQGHEGMEYSLMSRDLIAAMSEVHYSANPCDGVVFVSSCDKAVPAHLMAMARCSVPSVFLPGGVMRTGKNGMTLEQVGKYNVDYKRKKISKEEFLEIKKNACTTCGACQFMGTAGTMQVLAEALGVAPPFSALTPFAGDDIRKNAAKAADYLIELIKKNITPLKILTRKAFENAAIVFTAVGGSTNALLHLPAIAKAAGIEFTVEDIDRLGKNVAHITNTRPQGIYATEILWQAGGIPAIMQEVKEFLHLDALTCTGLTVGENLKRAKSKIARLRKRLAERNIQPSDVIKTMGERGSIAVLKGNIASEGCVIKYSAIKSGMRYFKGTAKVFDDENSARDAILERKIKPGTVIVIRYCGPKAIGMPELFYTTEALASDEELSATTAIVTDGRFSGASRGPNVGHVCPEAARGGEIAFIEDGDIIEVDIPNRSINLICDDFGKLMQERRKRIQVKQMEHKGFLQIYCENAESAIRGGAMKRRQNG